MAEVIKRITHGIRTRRAGLTSWQVLLLALLAVLIVLLLVARVVLASYIVAEGRRLQEMRAELVRLRQHISQLAEEIAERRDPAELFRQAQEMGLVPAERVERLER